MREPVIVTPRRTFGSIFLTLVRMNRWAPLFPAGMALGLVAVTALFPPSTPGPAAFWRLVVEEWGVFLAVLLALYAWQASHVVKAHRERGPETYGIDEEGISCTGVGDDTWRPWADIRRVCVSRHDVLLYFSYGGAYAVPRAQISADEESRLLAMARSAGVRVRGLLRRNLPDPA